MRNLWMTLLMAGAAWAGDADYNGKWDIQVINDPRSRAWWLQVEGAGTGDMKGKFVGFPGGDTNTIEKIWLDNGELHFAFDRGKVHQDYSAKLQQGKLRGMMVQGDQKWDWIGSRAPELKEKDDGTWREGTPVELFNGKDLSGWKAMIPGKELGWKVENGVMKNVASANNLVSERTFWNFKLHVEYRVTKDSNSGIGLRGRYEVQILDDYGKPPNTHGNGALYSKILPTRNASKPAGEWQTVDITLVGRQVTVVLNDAKIIDKGEIEGLTAIASDPDESKPGPITLQGDHREVEFRKIVLTPLVK